VKYYDEDGNIKPGVTIKNLNPEEYMIFLTENKIKNLIKIGEREEAEDLINGLHRQIWKPKKNIIKLVSLHKH